MTQLPYQHDGLTNQLLFDASGFPAATDNLWQQQHQPQPQQQQQPHHQLLQPLPSIMTMSQEGNLPQMVVEDQVGTLGSVDNANQPNPAWMTYHNPLRTHSGGVGTGAARANLDLRHSSMAPPGDSGPMIPTTVTATASNQPYQEGSPLVHPSPASPEDNINRTRIQHQGRPRARRPQEVISTNKQMPRSVKIKHYHIIHAKHKSEIQELEAENTRVRYDIQTLRGELNNLMTIYENHRHTCQYPMERHFGLLAQ